jgi:hypothetical protein
MKGPAGAWPGAALLWLIAVGSLPGLTSREGGVRTGDAPLPRRGLAFAPLRGGGDAAEPRAGAGQGDADEDAWADKDAWAGGEHFSKVL